MKTVINLSLLALLSFSSVVKAFAPIAPNARPSRNIPQEVLFHRHLVLWSTPTKEDETKEQDNVMKKGNVNGDANIPELVAGSSSNDGSADDSKTEGLPWWWELVWDLDMMKTGVPGTEITFGDSANVFRTNIEQIYGGYPSLDGCPLAEGALDTIADGTMFVGLQNYYNSFGSPYKLCFGPKSFLVVSDPIQAKHILSTNNNLYDCDCNFDCECHHTPATGKRFLSRLLLPSHHLSGTPNKYGAPTLFTIQVALR